MTHPETVAIEQLEEALEEESPDSPSYPSTLHNLGSAYSRRYTRLGSVSDLKLAIQRYNQAAKHVDHGDSRRPMILAALVDAHISRFEATNERKDLDSLINYALEAVELFPERHDRRASLHGALGAAYCNRYEQNGEIHNLQLAIQHHQIEFETTVDGNEARISTLKKICQIHQMKVAKSPDLSGIQAAIIKHQELLRLMPDEDSHSRMHRHGFAELCFLKYQRTRAIGDLRNAAISTRISINETTNDDPNKIVRLRTLGALLYNIFEVTKEVKVLEECIRNYQKALDLTPAGESSDRYIQLYEIAVLHANHHAATKQVVSMETSVRMMEEALENMSQSQEGRGSLLDALQYGHLVLYNNKGSRADFEYWFSRFEDTAAAARPDNQGQSDLLEDNIIDKQQPRYKLVVTVKDPQYMALATASAHGHKDYVQKLLGSVSNIDSLADGPTTALHRAAGNGHADIVQLLLDAGANIHQDAQSYGTPLFAAVKEGHVEAARLLLQRGADINYTEKLSKVTLLQAATAFGRTDMLRFLLEQGVGTSGGLKNALCIASDRGYENIVRILLEHGTGTSDGSIPTNVLHIAADCGHHEIVRLLISKGADVNERNEFDDLPLNLAAGKGRLESVRSLLDNGADVNGTVRGVTSLHRSVCFQHKETAQLLLSKGAGVNARDQAGQSPMHTAANGGFVDMMQILIEGGGDLSARNFCDRTPLHCACMRGHADMVEKLLGCDVPGADGVDRFGSTLLSLAARQGHLATVELLLQQSAVTLDKKDVLGRSALDWARREGHAEIADKILVKSRVLGISMEDATTLAVAAGVEGEIKPATQYCDVCTLFIRKGSRFHCSLCNGGDFDVCRDCIDAGAHCFDREHRLELTVP